MITYTIVITGAAVSLLCVCKALECIVHLAQKGNNK
jgi:hypothetical protein